MHREQLVKRCWEPEVDLWNCRPEKRLRLDAGLPDGGCPMEILPALLRTPQEEEKRRGQVESGGQVCVFRPGSPPLTCLRCLAGEPGHINHMMPAGGGPSTNPR